MEYDEDTPLSTSPSTRKTSTPTKILFVKTGTHTASKSPSPSHAGFNLGVLSSLPNTDWIASINANTT
ncbi:hypothetical protein NXV76_22240 [Parabacteroides distasonis]|uniref:hypothetical protein n=1 Tax=Parabacteroides distasonis TaxID=823 RepID=UPI002165B07D|nr:hypothetical protein [Parabacteroides distasonis]MCS2858556.1 hypothetical protein [Parabacteroides distasonis]